MSTKPQVVVVGAGLMGRWHAFSAVATGARLEAVVDPVIERAESLQKQFGAKHVFTTLRECLEKSDFDIVHICTPVSNHLESIELSLAHKKHVIAEKPLLSSLADTERILLKANENGLKIVPVHQMPFQKGASGLAADHSQLGKLVRLNHTAYTSGGEGKSDEARLAVLLEILPHPISLFFRFFKEKLTPDTFQIRRYFDGELELDGMVDDTLLRISVSLRGRPTRNELVVTGDSATAHIDLFHGFATIESGEVSRTSKILKPFRFGSNLVFDAGRNLIARSAQNEVAYPGLRTLIRQFYKSAMDGAPVPICEGEIKLCAAVQDKVRSSIN